MEWSLSDLDWERRKMNAFVCSRRCFLKGLGASAAALAMPGRLDANDVPPVKNLNFVFVLADDLGWSDLGCYGSDLHETPHIDRFAQRSMLFTDAYAASPVCTPTRASIMTGKYPARLHMTTWYEASKNPPRDRKLIPPVTEGNLPLEQVTIAEVLKQAGYQTAHVGKWHLGDAAHYPETQGFDVNIGGTFWGAPNTFFYPYRGLEAFGEFRYVPHLEFGGPGEYLTDRLTDEALHIMEKVKNAPFFLYLAYHTVHTPIEGKPEWVEYFRAKIRPGLRHQNPGYAAMVHSLDENVGRILGALDKLGLADHTVVVFFSDNGGFINKHKNQMVTDNYPLRSGKGSLYEGGIRVPLIVRWPGVTKPGGVCNEPISSIDFYPTILEMTGLSGSPQHNTDMDGLSIVPMLKNPLSSMNRTALYWHFPHYYPTTTPVSSIRKGDWKLMEFFEGRALELYNVKEDIAEKNNIAEKIPDKAAELHNMLKAWREETRAQLPEPSPQYRPTGSIGDF
jgi:arylsulfatase A-like enzyme